MLNISDLLYLPISQVAQLLQLANLIQTVPRGDEYDIWTYIWGAPFFASMKAYKHLLGYRFVHPYYTWLQKSAAQKKHKVFFFLLLKDRLIIRNILHHKNRVLPSYDHVLCSTSHEETVEHLFLNCHFAQGCWSLLHLIIVPGDPFQVLSSLRDQLDAKF